jgi:ribosomal protein S18 acetylase RimI-like enzyme
VDTEPARIRPYRPGDLADLYRICLQTADNGQDATAIFRDPKLPGHVYAAAYATFEPSLCFVAEDAAGVGGYIVGALDSQAFERRLERDWWPALRVSYPEPPEDLAAGLSLAEQYAIHDIHHPWPPSADLGTPFPSHLHINLLPRLQGRGIGRRLIETLIGSLRGQGSRGVHLVVGHGNGRAADFYRHIGFMELPATDVHLLGMDLRGAGDHA